VQYAMGLVHLKGYTPIITHPTWLASRSSKASVSCRAGEGTQIYSIANSDLCLIADGPRSRWAGMHRDEIFEEDELPHQVHRPIALAFAPRPALPGRDARGPLSRAPVHQGSRCSPFARPNRAREIHKEILAIEEEIFTNLGIPIPGDRHVHRRPSAGQPIASTISKLGLPGRGKRRRIRRSDQHLELHRLSSRAASNIRYKNPSQKGTKFVPHAQRHRRRHPRGALIAILENYQEIDGSVRIPEVLSSAVDVRQGTHHAADRGVKAKRILLAMSPLAA